VIGPLHMKRLQAVNGPGPSMLKKERGLSLGTASVGHKVVFDQLTPALAKTFQDICRQAVDDNALLFDADKLQAEPIAMPGSIPASAFA